MLFCCATFFQLTTSPYNVQTLWRVDLNYPSRHTTLFTLLCRCHSRYLFDILRIKTKFPTVVSSRCDTAICLTWKLWQSKHSCAGLVTCRMSGDMVSKLSTDGSCSNGLKREAGQRNVSGIVWGTIFKCVSQARSSRAKRKEATSKRRRRQIGAYSHRHRHPQHLCQWSKRL